MRYKKIDPKVYLTSTDTVVGFISQNRVKLDKIKGRGATKQYITALPSLRTLKDHTRIPAKHLNLVRRSKRTTFIFPNGRSFRVIKDNPHHELIQKLGWAYTTSANRSGKQYDEKWARTVADETILPLKSLQNRPSVIYLLGKNTIKKIR